MSATLPRLAADDPRLTGRHLLALPDDVSAEEVEVLALSRFPGARWDTPVPDAMPRGRAARDPLAGVGVLRLSRHSSALGPFRLLPDAARALGLPDGAVAGFVVATPRERGEAPYPGGDRDGLARAFPAGMPVREEERVLRWLVDAARRLDGWVRVDDGAVLAPDAAAAVDLTVHSPLWLEPDDAVAVVRRVAPTAVLALDPVPWDGPVAPPPAMPTPVTALGERARRRLHERAAEHDAAALAAPTELDGYGIAVDLGPDGMVVVEAGGEDVVPPVLRGVAWAAGGTVAYRVRWEPVDVEDLERERPTPAHRAARDRARPLVSATAGALHAVVGGEVADHAEFLVDPADL